MSAATHLLDEHAAEEVLWTRPVWRDPRAMREVERGVVVERLRPRVVSLTLEATRQAGLWGELPARRSTPFVWSRAVGLARTLVALTEDDYSRLLLANAVMSTGANGWALKIFSRLEHAASDRRMREYATLGLTVAASLLKRRDIVFERSKTIMHASEPNVHLRGAMTLTIQAALAGNFESARQAVHSLSAHDAEHSLVTLATVIQCRMPTFGQVEGTRMMQILQRCGELGAEVVGRCRAQGVSAILK